MSLIVDLGRALAQIGDPRFRAVLWKSLGLTLLALALVFWATMLALGWLLPDTVTLPWIGEVGFVDDLASWAAVGLMLVLSVVLMVPAAAARRRLLPRGRRRGGRGAPLPGAAAGADPGRRASRSATRCASSVSSSG